MTLGEEYMVFTVLFWGFITVQNKESREKIVCLNTASHLGYILVVLLWAFASSGLSFLGADGKTARVLWVSQDEMSSALLFTLPSRILWCSTASSSLGTGCHVSLGSCQGGNQSSAPSYGSCFKHWCSCALKHGPFSCPPTWTHELFL